MSNNVRDFSTVSDAQDILVQKQPEVAGEVSVTPGAVISGGCFPFGFSLQGYTIHRCERYPVCIDLYAEEGKKEPTF